jgi:type I restriction enzyme S subunit
MEVKQGYKETEIGVIPSDWEICTLSEAVEFLDGQRRPIKSSNREKITGGYPYYGASGIIDYVDNYIFDDNLILLGEDGENILSRNLPLAFKVSGKIWVNNHAHVLKPKVDFEISFLTDYLESLDYSLLNSGTAQPKLNKQACSNLKIVKPTLAEQTAIATALSDADNYIASLEKLIAKKRLIKQGAMQQLLKPKEGWVVKKLGELFIITAGGDLNKNCFSQIQDENFIYPIYSNAHTNKGLYGYSSVYISNENTITVTARGEIGLAVPRYTKYTAIGRVLILNPIDEIDCFFVAECINNFVDFANESTGVPQLTAPQISNYEITIPSYKEQTRISTILSDMDTEVGTLEKQLSKAQSIKQGMMQQLLTGKIRLV